MNKPSLNDPEAIQLLDQLQKLIAVADSAFRPSGPFVYPSRLNQIPRIVEQLQEFLGRRKPVRIPFWNCVKAVDERRRKLGLVETLTAMVDRATSMAPGPLFRLLTARDKGTIDAHEREALSILDQHLQTRPNKPPQNLQEYRSLFAKVHSAEYKKLEGRLARALIDRPFEDMLDYAVYLDFCHRHYRWIDLYQEPLEDLYGLLLEFNNDEFYRQINRVLHGGTPKEANQRDWQRKSSGRERIAKHREGKKVPPRPVVPSEPTPL